MWDGKDSPSVKDRSSGVITAGGSRKFRQDSMVPEKQLACYDPNKENELDFVTRKGTAVMIMKRRNGILQKGTKRQRRSLLISPADLPDGHS